MPVTVIGMGLSPADLTPRHREIIESADILVGGRRHLAAFDGVAAENWPIGRDLDGLMARIREVVAEKTVVVLASGDPLFFGIGARVVDALGPEKVEIHPNISSVAAAFARIKMAWQDAKVLSVHGRFQPGALLSALRRHDTIAILTDPRRTPAWLAGFLKEHRIAGCSMWVFERMGSEEEKIHFFEEVGPARDLDVDDPNLVILHQSSSAESAAASIYPGMADEDFLHERGLITKSEVRAVTLSKLKLDRPDLVLWDLGAGSGSVGIEASRFLADGMVCAVERKAKRVQQIMENRDRFGVHNLEAVQAELPEGLERLPGPDRVFVGGGGKQLPAILRAAGQRLRAGGLIVVNTVLIQSVSAALATLRELDFETDVAQIQVCAGKGMPWGERLEAQNPVWIIRGR